MATILHLDPDLIKEVLDELPELERKKLLKAMGESERKEVLSLIKAFVEQYEIDDPIDHIVGMVAQEVIGRCGQGIHKAVKEAHKKGKEFSGVKALRVCVREIREMCDNYDKRLK